MSDALRPSSLFNSAAPATAPSGVLATLRNPPPEISQLPAGTTIRGTVVGHDDSGHLLVRTDLGTLAVSTKANPPPGSEVVLQIRSSGAQLHVLLMHSDLAAGGGGSKLAPTTQPGFSAPAPDRLTLGQTVQATVQAPAANGPVPTVAGPGGASAIDPAVLAGLARLAPGSQITVHILSVGQPIPAAVAPTAAAPPPAPPGAAFTADPTLTAGQVSLPPGSPGPGGSQAAGSSTPSGPPALSSPANPGALPTGTSPPVTGAAPSASPPGPGGAPLSAATIPIPPSQPVGNPTAGSIPDAPGANLPIGAAGPGPAQGASFPPAQLGASTAPTPQSFPGPAAGAGQSAPFDPRLPGPVSSPATAPQTRAAPMNYTTPARTGGAPGPLSADGTPTGLRLTGVVTTPPGASQPVLQTPIGTLTLGVRTTLAIGSQVIFDVVPGSLPQAGSGATPLSDELQRLPASLARAWPALEEAIRVLHESPPPHHAAGGGAAIVPQPGPRLASGLLFFLAALSGGNVGHWLGNQAAQALKDAGRGDLLTRLAQDFGQLSRTVEAGGTDWRLFLIPIHDGHQVQQIRFFERHGANQRHADDDQDSEATRFILEVELSRLGDMQIDGLVRGQRFDLILRTRRPLPDTMRQRIAEIFNDANDGAGYAGSVGFQSSRDWRFMPVTGAATPGAGAGFVI